MKKEKQSKNVEVITFGAPANQWEWLDAKTEEARKTNPVASRSDIIRKVVAEAMRRDPLTKS